MMICMMSFPPRVVPPIDYYIPPLNFKIERTSDPLSSVTYFLTILIYSLYLGFIGYLAMLCNFNRPTNRLVWVCVRTCVLQGRRRIVTTLNLNIG